MRCYPRMLTNDCHCCCHCTFFFLCYITNHLMTGPSGNKINCFPWDQSFKCLVSSNYCSSSIRMNGCIYFKLKNDTVGGTVASLLVRSTPDRVVQVWVLAGDVVLCCVLGQDTLLSQCLSPPRCINGYW